MKFAVKIVLLIFLIFLSTPTVVATIEKSCDTYILFGMSEEELTHQEIKVVKDELVSHDDSSFVLFGLKPVVISSENDVKHSNGYLTIFSPPPNC